MLRILLLLCTILYAGKIKNPAKKLSESLEFNNAGTGIFSILKNSTKNITYPDTIKDLKIDIVIKNKQLKPEIGVELLPFYLTMFKNKTYQEIKEMPYLLRQLQDVKLGIGNKLIDTNYVLGSSIVYVLYQKNNIAFNTNVIEEIKRVYNDDRIQKLQEKQVTAFITGKDVNKIEKELNKLKKEIEEKRNKIIENYRKEYWNSIYIQIGFAELFHYTMTPDFKDFTATKFEHIILYQSGFGIGKYILFSQILRFYFTEKKIYSGINIHFKKNKNNFFIEYLNNYYINNNRMDYNLNFGIDVFFKKNMISLGCNFYFNDGLESIEPTYNFNFKF